MSKNLVIVESPAKAKTIEGFLGKDFTVKSSYGHVRDLVKKGLGIDVEHDFKPEYEVSKDKVKVIKELKDLVKKAEVVWLATDEDREGEAISWHLEQSLDLQKKETRRIVFHEITKSAITKAIENPRKIDYHLVDAQQARRILDRLVGFELSPILWKRVKPSLSAGRVQSVTVRLIVEREREVQDFKSEYYFRVVAKFQVGKKAFQAELNKRFAEAKEAREFLESCLKADFKVGSLEVNPAKKSPAAPFTTSTLQQEAGRKLSFSVARTMTVAQKLYEEGHITYMRTDSLNLSDTALNAAKKEIQSTYGDAYVQTRKFTTKTKGAQEAHEAIRPVDMAAKSVPGDASAQRLYDLIYKRTLASQMADAQLEKTKLTIQILRNSTVDQTYQFNAQGEVIKFDGFLKVYLEDQDDDEEKEEQTTLPPMKVGEELQRNEISATQRFKNHPPRYSEASLVKKLEELGIGRPSTYAPTISTVQNRGYVVKEDKEGTRRNYTQFLLNEKGVAEEQKSENTGAEKSKLFPTDIGMVVNDFLVKHFERILSYDFTATVEKQFDDIADGQLKWKDMIKNFYTGFHSNVEKTLEEADRATGERAIGIDPASGQPIIVRIGRYGPMAQIGETEEGKDKPRFASLRSDQSIMTITLEEVLDLFKLPRNVGEYQGKEITAAVGRFGPYLRHNSAFYSIKESEGDDPLSINLERSIEVIEAKIKADKEKLIKTFPEDDSIQVLNGRWGPYIKAGKDNHKIAKGADAAALTYADVQKIIAEGPSKPAGGAARRKTNSKK